MDGRSLPEGQVEDGARTSLFERQRQRLRGIAYRMLGSLGDAEDIVQEALLRWHAADAAAIRSAEAWLVATTTRLAIDMINIWNRIAIGFRAVHPQRTPKAA